MTMQESPSYFYHLSTAVWLAALVVLYAIGTWSRGYILPVSDATPLKHQILASVPVGFITMGVYAKNAFPSLTLENRSLVFDCAIMLGYAVVLGMLSRETLERILAGLQKSGSPRG